MSIWYQRFRLSDEPNKSILTTEVRKRALIGLTHWEARLQRIPDSVAYKKEIKNYIDNMPTNEAQGKGFIFFGPLGTGKTALGTIVLRNALARGARVLTMRSADVIDGLMANRMPTIPNGAPLLEALRNVNYLLLDDLEANEKDWRMRKIEGVLRARYDNKLATIITTNMNREDMFSIPWLKSLLFDKAKYTGVEVTGINWRSKPPKENS